MGRSPNERLNLDESGQASPESSLRAAPQSKSPALKNPHHSFLMACTVFFRASPQSTLLLFFSVTLFAVNTQLAHCFFSFLKKAISQSTHEAKKKSGTPTATTVPEMRQKKNNSKLCIHNA